VGEFTHDSRIRDVINDAPLGRELLYEHGYDAGEGFSDTLSHYLPLLQAERLGRLRDLEGLLKQLNEA
jgi:hypothetical protein